jgi:hypothetical protein
MTHDTSGYGLWALVILNSAVFLMFAFSFFKPQRRATGEPLALLPPLSLHFLSRCTDFH